MSSSPELRITFHAPTGILSVSWRHMQVHGKVEDVEAFAGMLLREVRDRRPEPSVFPTDFIHELVAMDI